MTEEVLYPEHAEHRIARNAHARSPCVFSGKLSTHIIVHQGPEESTG